MHHRVLIGVEIQMIPVLLLVIGYSSTSVFKITRYVTRYNALRNVTLPQRYITDPHNADFHDLRFLAHNVCYVMTVT